MSISPPSDIVLGVANAVDPRQYRAAVEKLAKASAAAGTHEERSEALVPVALTDAAQATITRPQPQTNASSPKAYQDFEAFFLQTFVEAMLPKEAESLFGHGPAGKIWKSMLAEHLANELAKSSAFGIAAKIADSRQGQDDDGAAPANAVSNKTPAKDNETASYIIDLQKLLATDTGTSLGVSAPITRG